jgi:phospholipid-binding lipoprotein MlaA
MLRDIPSRSVTMQAIPVTQPTHTARFSSMRAKPALAGALALLALAGCGQAPLRAGCDPLATQVHDPAESVNRGVFAFNRVLDDYALKPVARGYRQLPDAVQTGVHNFASNLGEPKVFVNDVLQGNVGRSANTFTRFALNTTFGGLGLFDVARHLGMPHHQADFGQTFGVWGVGNGPTVELPLFGSANSRDAVGRVLGFVIDPLGGINSDSVDTMKTVGTVGGTVDGRAGALPLTDRLEHDADYYRALRNAAAQRRAALVAEGKDGARVADAATVRPAAAPVCELAMLDKPTHGR